MFFNQIIYPASLIYSSIDNQLTVTKIWYTIFYLNIRQKEKITPSETFLKICIREILSKNVT